MKQPGWKTPLILSATLFTLGGFAYWLEYSHKPKQEKVESAQKKPMNFDENAQIASLAVRGSKITLNAKCDEIAQKKCKISDSPAWTITAPQEFKGDTDSIKSLLNTVSNAIAAETVDLKEDAPEKRQQLLNDFALSESKRNSATTPMIEFTLDNGKKYAMYFGIEHPIGDKYYTLSSVDGKFNEETIFLIASHIKALTDHGLTQFRDKTVFNFNRTDVKKISGRNSSGPIKGSKTDQRWELNGLDADYEKVEVVLASIAQIKAKDFPGTKDVLKGAKSVIQYTLETEKEKISLEVYEKTLGNQEKHFYLTSSVRPDVVEVEAAIRNQLDKKLNDLRNPIFFSASDKMAAQTLKIEGRKFKTPIEAKLENGKWNPDQANIMLDVFTRAKIQEFVSNPLSGTDEIRMTLGDGKNTTRFRWSIFQHNGKTYLRDLNSKKSEAYEVGVEVKNALPADSESWKIKK